MRASFRLATRARVALRLPGCLRFRKRAPRDACGRLLLPYTPSHHVHPCLVGSRRASEPQGLRARRGVQSVSRHPARFGGSRLGSLSLLPLLRRIVGRFLPLARRATVPLAPPSPHARAPCEAAARTTETASASPSCERRRSSTIRGAFHRRGTAPSIRTPSRAPDLDALLLRPATLCVACRSSSPFRLRLPVARPFRCACSARRGLGPVRARPRSVRKRRLLASLDRRRRPTTSTTRHDPRAHPSSC